MNKQMTVHRIEKNEDRTCLFGDDSQSVLPYIVIAKPEEPVQVGDVIEYEPYGVNFGFFVRQISKRKETDVKELLCQTK